MLGYIVTGGDDNRGMGNLVLAALAGQLAADGVRLAGTVQENTRPRPDCACDMDLKVLPEGPAFRITQALGPGASGCRLDTSALEEAAGLVLASLSGAGPAPDLLVVNKFAKTEAAGRAFRPVIAAALEAGVPVLAAVPARWVPEFVDFAGTMAMRIGDLQDMDRDTHSVDTGPLHTPPALLEWCRSAIARHVPAAEIDARGLLCPLPVLRLQKQLARAAPGSVVRLAATDPAARLDVPHFCAQSGHDLLGTADDAGARLYAVRCRARAAPQVPPGTAPVRQAVT